MKKPAKFKIFRLKNEVDFTFERFSYKRLRRRSCRWLYTDKINKYDNKLFKSSLDNFLLMGISFLRKKMYFIQKFRKLIKGKQESYNSRKYLI